MHYAMYTLAHSPQLFHPLLIIKAIKSPLPRPERTSLYKNRCLFMQSPSFLRKMVPEWIFLNNVFLLLLQTALLPVFWVLQHLLASEAFYIWREIVKMRTFLRHLPSPWEMLLTKRRQSKSISARNFFLLQLTFKDCFRSSVFWTLLRNET